jgi:hypothetical protein
MHAVALANTPACNSHRNGLRGPFQCIAFFRAVILHLPSQYIFISLCSISAMPLAVLLFRDADIMKKYGLYSFKWKIIPNFVAD